MRENWKNFSKVTTPCKDCEDRFVRVDGDKIERCHTKCERYKEFRAKIDEVNKREQAVKAKERELPSYKRVRK